MKKKLLSVLLCTAMITTVLAGCGSGSDAGSAPAAEAPAAEEPAAEAPAAEEPAAEAPAAEAGSSEEAEIYMFISSPEYADAINTLTSTKM